MKIPTSYLTGDVKIGDYVELMKDPAGDVDVNTVVTRFAIVYPVGGRDDGGGKNSIEYQTSFAELDAIR